MKLNFLLIGLILLSFNAFSQTPESASKNFISVYSNFEFAQKEFYLTPSSDEEISIKQQANLGWLSFSWRKALNENWHKEYSLENLTILKQEDILHSINNGTDSSGVVSHFRQSTSHAGLRLEYFRNLGKPEGNKLTFQLGASIRGGFTYLNFTPKISALFSTQANVVQASLDLIPRMSYKLNPKCAVNLNVIAPVISTYVSASQNSNPANPEFLRSSSVFNLDTFLLPNHIRIGFSYEI